MTKFRIPRNVKQGLMFMGLELKGWLLYLPTVLVLGALVILLIPNMKIKVIVLFFVIALSHVLFQTDEKTGVMNITLFTDRMRWIYFSEKIIEPVWSEEFERTSTLQITVQKQRTRDTEAGNTD